MEGEVVETATQTLRDQPTQIIAQTTNTANSGQPSSSNREKKRRSFGIKVGVDAREKVFSEIVKIEDLSKAERIKAGQRISSESIARGQAENFDGIESRNGGRRW
ncbi:hypothetical protein CCACVL1_04382 [Corchorus capsularis]|uniref:Uncharacterized protein n=1 Tax=Corchorus capsularis TaxID=210143 RepID=A0A1R3JT76_COCAP|nr:hypothetical protein CCACVL1_04382 [Corchorus capsularis]